MAKVKKGLEIEIVASQKKQYIDTTTTIKKRENKSKKSHIKQYFEVTNLLH